MKEQRALRVLESECLWQVFVYGWDQTEDFMTGYVDCSHPDRRVARRMALAACREAAR